VTFDFAVWNLDAMRISSKRTETSMQRGSWENVMGDEWLFLIPENQARGCAS